MAADWVQRRVWNHITRVSRRGTFCRGVLSGAASPRNRSRSSLYRAFATSENSEKKTSWRIGVSSAAGRYSSSSATFGSVALADVQYQPSNDAFGGSWALGSRVGCDFWRPFHSQLSQASGSTRVRSGQSGASKIRQGLDITALPLAEAGTASCPSHWPTPCDLWSPSFPFNTLSTTT